MKTLAPPFHEPEYEYADDGCEVQARWPGLVAAARSSALTSDVPVFCEFSPLPGGLHLLGVGCRTAGSARSGGGSLREAILAHLLAGETLGESLSSALGRFERGPSDVSVLYAVLDPIEATAHICGFGPCASAVHLIGGVPRLVKEGLEFDQVASRSIHLRESEALLLVTHHRSWDKHLLGALSRVVTDDGDFVERDALRLCRRLPTLFAGSSASALAYRSLSNAAGSRNLLRSGARKS